MSLEFRDLKAEEVECRVAHVTDKGLSLLPYKDARCDMRILDETVGAERWQREHYLLDSRLFCRVGIRTDDGWVWKSDCGVESNAEAVKGESSDSFKRACVNWGIGRELYTSPFIWVDASNCEIKKGANGKPTCRDKFKVSKITIKNKEIVGLEVINTSRKSQVVYTMGKPTKATPKDTPKQQPATQEQKAATKKAADEMLEALKRWCELKGANFNKSKEGIKKRSDFANTHEFYAKVKAEFEADMPKAS